MGVQKTGATTVTSCVTGNFRSDPRTRSELFELIAGQRGSKL
eukprot:NODE_4313_length_350_cov_157.421927_g3870_i0.p1 GENE.NODE_4313_length_350_cov_157.421927_g3870_i0~~NODE_4313_length_350_cov_157.421927_g3870_i0.p1  ORF type:complete len:50 (-),score=15.82 NODE_4313_length_350_cov_157.421927_g3870_i0:200-325(-)